MLAAAAAAAAYQHAVQAANATCAIHAYTSAAAPIYASASCQL
jgi:hypothetical protein